VEDAAAYALASLPGRTGIAATTQEGAELPCDPIGLEGEVLRAYLPRLQMGGVRQLTLRFAVDGQPWRALFDLDEAEYHSFEQAIGVLRLVEIEPDGTGRGAQRVDLHAGARLTAIFCTNAVYGNQYDARVHDLSETGVQLSTDLEAEPGDEFALEVDLEERRIRFEAKAVKVADRAMGRSRVGARITGISDADLMVIRRLAAGAG
jgi:PilZ domain